MVEKFPANIEEQMCIKPMEDPPKNLEGVLTQHQLEEFPERDRPVLMAISKIEQLIRWHISQTSEAVNQARRSEAGLIQKTTRARNAIVFLLGVLVTALITAGVQHFIK